MLRFGICFCKPGVMSECDPDGNDRNMCDFYRKHSFAPRCTNLNTDMNNHCWSDKAQQFGYHPDGDPDAIGDEDQDVGQPRYIIPEPAVEPTLNPNVVRRSCLGCDNHPLCPLLPMEAAAISKSHNSLTDQDYWTIGTGCSAYEPDLGGVI